MIALVWRLPSRFVSSLVILNSPAPLSRASVVLERTRGKEISVRSTAVDRADAPTVHKYVTDAANVCEVLHAGQCVDLLEVRC